MQSPELAKIEELSRIGPSEALILPKIESPKSSIATSEYSKFVFQRETPAEAE